MPKSAPSGAQEPCVEEVKLLDHGFCRLIETWGSDERIVEAARMSTQKGFEGWGPYLCVACGGSGDEQPHAVAGVQDETCPRCKGTGYTPGDERLLRYLWEHKHATPFEMAGAVFEVQAPIFVFREWHRHRTQSYNEMSARYAPLPDMNYMPTVERLFPLKTGNKQAGTVSGASILTENSAKSYQYGLQIMYQAAEEHYQRSLQAGVPKELARLVLPVGRYSRMRASANLRNWLAFLTLRMDQAAQWEIRCYAQAVHDILAKRFPRTLELFDERRPDH